MRGKYKKRRENQLKQDLFDASIQNMLRNADTLNDIISWRIEHPVQSWLMGILNKRGK